MKTIIEIEQIILASFLPIIYLYSQMILKLDSGTFSMVLICVGEVLLALIVQQHNNKAKTFISS